MKVLIKYINKNTGNIKYQEVEGEFVEIEGKKTLKFDFINDEKGDVELLEASY